MIEEIGKVKHNSMYIVDAVHRQSYSWPEDTMYTMQPSKGKYN